ncbi:EAL/GGDEF domain signaling protein [Salinisphaera sp. T5B8]|uniref:bifunctional diguanylate cyclase/phosphodiesterase n=1 Tax=Salinisphaera sp. T5B8 TaxID=1304154 RepID=UPI00333FB4FD
MQQAVHHTVREHDDKADFLGVIARHIDYAFQPIVSLNSGRCYGVEALMRGYGDAGFSTIDRVFDYAHANDLLVETDALLKQLAVEKFCRISHHRALRLFFNLDNRLFGLPGFRAVSTMQLLEQYGLRASSMVLEVSERKHLDRGRASRDILQFFRDSTVQVALDDFGTGFSGLALLYDTHPEYVKIDRYFVADIGSNRKKKVFLSHVVSLARTLGIRVVAEGVETEAEFYTCREIGCDLVQGYLIQRPTTRVDQLVPVYEVVGRIRGNDRRREQLESRFVGDQLDGAPAIDVDMRMEDIFESFRVNPQRSFFPFLDDNRHPIGVIRETELKEYIYSPYGRDLLSRKKIDDHLDLFVRRCPVADINTPIDTILEQYAVSPSRDGVIITEDGRYRGVLSAEALVLAVQERNLELARDQNPLTGLPGNPSIERFIGTHLPDANALTLMYFDLDNFKTFNDAYGFRMGDRALRMFAERLSKVFGGFGGLVAHIGGDDFFGGLQNVSFAAGFEAALSVVASFRRDAESLYDEKHRQAGYIVGHDRRGQRARFALLSASCALVQLAGQSGQRHECALMGLITRLKEEAKRSGNTVSPASLL